MFCISLRHCEEMRFYVYLLNRCAVHSVRNFNTRAPNDNDRQLMADRLNGEKKAHCSFWCRHTFSNETITCHRHTWAKTIHFLSSHALQSRVHFASPFCNQLTVFYWAIFKICASVTFDTIAKSSIRWLCAAFWFEIRHFVRTRKRQTSQVKRKFKSA